MKLEYNSKERKKYIHILKLRVKHRHNDQVIEEKQLKVAVARRSVSKTFVFKIIHCVQTAWN